MNKKEPVKVLKASGDLAPFNRQKLEASLKRAGADKASVAHIVDEIEMVLYEGITTGEIYRKAFDMLKSMARPAAAKYRLKAAIMELGPTGFPFERFIGELLKQQGYVIQLDVLLDGKCVTHEVDVIAEKDNNLNYIECKFHNLRGTVCDVKVPLYIHSRFNDLQARQAPLPENKGRAFKGWVVTNTKFSDDAIKYGLCAGLQLVSWDYPQGNSLREIIDLTGLHPVTCLTSLTQREKQWLMDNKMVLCRDVLANHKALTDLGIKPNRLKNVIQEAGLLCQTATE